MTAGAVCLGVTQSLAGKTWRFRLADEDRASAIARSQQMPDALARILAARGFVEADAGRHFDASLKSWMPDPSSFADMDKAAARIADAIAGNEKAAVFGDYDVDGGASSALMARYFRALGREIRIYIPDRMTEGYGPSANAMRTLAGEGATLVITVDCAERPCLNLERSRSLSNQARYPSTLNGSQIDRYWLVSRCDKRILN